MSARYPGPRDPGLRAQWLAQRRALVRQFHPDTGGDGALMTAALEDLDRSFAVRDGAPAPLADALADLHLVELTASDALPEQLRRSLRRGRRRARDLGRGVRARIPGGWPGSRRYLDL
ncbi:hypothetical protein [Nocardioides sp.]|uniref:hypothetical protein n=1 Tax=Nocardioides sp. TaxID=35761 RepID=UPI003517C309